jgi:hypothetical protein
MARLPTGGAAICSPRREEGDLKRVLSDLGLAHVLDDTAVHHLYLKIGAILGRWQSERDRLEVSLVAKTLLSTAKNLGEASSLLSGHETGLRRSLEMAVTSQVAKYLALDPTVGSFPKAQALITTFQRDAARIAHVCMVARAALPDGPDKRGRRSLDWYDEFVALLLELADKAGVTPTLRKDRVTGVRSGWLLDAARTLETFLYPPMHSRTAEACGKRLERSRRRLQHAGRHNSSSR